MKLLNAKEMSEVLTVSPSTLYGMVKRREVPHFRIGDRVVFDADSVLAALRVPADCDSDGRLGNLKKAVANDH
jgi:excisionase family DNA binding protein